jgi:hypothetical protein
MNNLVFLGAIFPMLILISQSHSVFAYNEPKHCNGYNRCYAIGYVDGYNDAQNGISPAYACVGHSENWCAGVFTMMDFAPEMVVVIFSMDRGVTKPQT